ncbi:MAG: hypothetical protein LBC86_09595 [Oscillospiraceae bacterium]|nr:hypothetical protein [Oscillospiraceae bacterium]
MPTLSKVFLDVFGEALAPIGFKKLKGKHPYFVRLIGDEIIHVIAYRSEITGISNSKAYSILCGIATVYNYQIDFKINPLYNNSWLKNISSHYIRLNLLDYDKGFYDSIVRISNYNPDDNESIVNAVKISLSDTKDIILPIFDKVVDIDSCIEYFYKIGQSMCLVYNEEKNRFNPEPLYLKTNNYNDLMKNEFEWSHIKFELKKGLPGYTGDDFIKKVKKLKKIKLK